MTLTQEQIAALPGLVKPLEWKWTGKHQEWRSNDPSGPDFIHRVAAVPDQADAYYEWNGGREEYPTLEAAKAAAQADYEARILSALNLPLIAQLSEDASKAAELALEVKRLTAENADLKNSVVAFCAPWAVRYADDHGMPEGHLHPTHYDILANAGARMAHFTRAALDGKP